MKNIMLLEEVLSVVKLVVCRFLIISIFHGNQNTLKCTFILIFGRVGVLDTNRTFFLLNNVKSKNVGKTQGHHNVWPKINSAVQTFL